MSRHRALATQYIYKKGGYERESSARVWSCCSKTLLCLTVMLNIIPCSDQLLKE